MYTGNWQELTEHQPRRRKVTLYQPIAKQVWFGDMLGRPSKIYKFKLSFVEKLNQTSLNASMKGLVITGPSTLTWDLEIPEGGGGKGQVTLFFGIFQILY